MAGGEEGCFLRVSIFCRLGRCKFVRFFWPPNPNFAIIIAQAWVSVSIHAVFFFGTDSFWHAYLGFQTMSKCNQSWLICNQHRRSQNAYLTDLSSLNLNTHFFFLSTHQIANALVLEKCVRWPGGMDLPQVTEVWLLRQVGSADYLHIFNDSSPWRVRALPQPGIFDTANYPSQLIAATLCFTPPACPQWAHITSSGSLCWFDGVCLAQLSCKGDWNSSRYTPLWEFAPPPKLCRLGIYGSRDLSDRLEESEKECGYTNPSLWVQLIPRGLWWTLIFTGQIIEGMRVKWIQDSEIGRPRTHTQWVSSDTQMPSSSTLHFPVCNAVLF